MPVHNAASGNNSGSAQTPATPAKAKSQGKTKNPKRGSAKWQEQQTKQKATATAQASKSVASAARSAEPSQQPATAPAAAAAALTQAEEPDWIRDFPMAEKDNQVGWYEITIKGDPTKPPVDPTGKDAEPEPCATADAHESGYRAGTGSMKKVVHAFTQKQHFTLIGKTKVNSFDDSRRVPDHAAFLDDNGVPESRVVKVFLCHAHGDTKAREDVATMHKWLDHHWGKQ